MPGLSQHTKKKESGEQQQSSKSYSIRTSGGFFKEINKPSMLKGTQVPELHAIGKVQDILAGFGINLGMDTQRRLDVMARFGHYFEADPLVRLNNIKSLEPELKDKIRRYISHLQKNIDENTSSKVPTLLIAFIIMCVFLSFFNNSNNSAINYSQNQFLNGVIGILFYAMLSLTIVYVSNFIYKLIKISVNLIKKRFLEEDVVGVIIYYLVSIIWLAEGNERRLTESEKRKQQVYLLEKIAKSIEDDLPRIFRGGDIATDAWVKETMTQVAAALREKKRFLLFPQKGTSNSFIKSITSSLKYIVEGNWGDMEKIEPKKLTRTELRRSIFQFVINLLKGTFVGSIPLMGFFVLQHTQFAVQGAIFTSTVTILVVYEISVFTSVLDPNFGDRISKAKDIKDFLQFPGINPNK